MLVKDAQNEVSHVYLGGSVGCAVSGLIWLASAGLATWNTPKAAMLMLVVGGFAIYPLTSISLRISGRPASLSTTNPFRFLAIQAAFVLPSTMLLVAPITAYRLDWFYPAMAVLVGAHYLPFATLYGMRSFLGLAAVLIGSGFVIALYIPGSFSLAGWVAGVVLIAFAGLGYAEWWHARQQFVQAAAQKARAAQLKR